MPVAPNSVRKSKAGRWLNYYVNSKLLFSWSEIVRSLASTTVASRTLGSQRIPTPFVFIKKKKKKNHRNPFSLSKSPWTLRECREIFLLPRKVRKGTKIIICICANDWMSQRFSKFVSLCEAGWMQREVYVAELTREQICNCPITFCIYSLIIYSENYWELLFVIMLSC